MPLAKQYDMTKIAVLGYGVVGSGVVEVLHDNAAVITGRVENIEIKYILTRRPYPGDPYESLITQNFSVIENDPEISIVAECIGGCGVAYDYVRRSLLAGKSVATSNKELIAEHGLELLELAGSLGLNLMFEASVGGGIPIIRPLHQCLAANRISEIHGIINGTTNYILTRMARAGLSFDQALKEAQDKGYAEADPTADIQGIDACRKICILADLAYGKYVSPAEVSTQGITGLTDQDVACAAAAGMKIKLLGRAAAGENGGLYVYVAPHMISLENQLAGVEDVFNAIVVRGNAIGDVMFYGRGAGKLPTASALVADIIDEAKHKGRPRLIHWEKPQDGYVLDCGLLESRWFVRAQVAADMAASLFGSIDVIPSSVEGETAFITGPMSRYTLEAAAGELGLTSVIRVLD